MGAVMRIMTGRARFNFYVIFFVTLPVQTGISNHLNHSNRVEGCAEIAIKFSHFLHIYVRIVTQAHT